ncbi:MAG TPA: hypothetical protein VGJ19_15895 [Streptosporangiaceae bacterium]
MEAGPLNEVNADVESFVAEDVPDPLPDFLLQLWKGIVQKGRRRRLYPQGLNVVSSFRRLAEPFGVDFGEVVHDVLFGIW